MPNLYQVLKKEVVDETTISVTVEVDKNHQVFEGHFPENPVMPGVCMLQVIKELSETHLETGLFLQKLSNVKFTSVMNPQVRPQLVLNLTFSKKNNEITVKNTSTFPNGTVVLKCNAIFVQTKRVHETA
ncbi:hotdog family protein [Marixanthomonas spongiae]|nr:3-hydroxyacyl-ACP dehydratase [Marixanthomonas spongiae]